MPVKKRTNHGNRNIIGNQLAIIDKLFGFYAKRRFISDLFTEQVARTNVDKTIFFNQPLGLGAFAAARRAK